MTDNTLPQSLQQEFHGVLFDLDGTLLDSEQLHYDAFTEAMKEFGYDFDRLTEDIEYKGSFRKMYEEIAAKEKLNPTQFHAIYDRKMEITIERHHHSSVDFVDGVVSFFELLTELQIPFGVVTNSDRPYAEHALQAHELDEYLQVVITSTEMQNVKPAPDGYVEGAQYLDIDPKHTLVFENTDAGIQAGKDAGMAVIAIHGTDAKGFSTYENADLVIDNFGDPHLNALSFRSSNE